MKRKLINLNDLTRKDNFLHFIKLDNPFVSLSTKVNVTNIYNYSKVNKHFYAIMNYCIMKAANAIHEFRLRYDGINIYEYFEIGMAPTDMIDENNFGWFSIPYKNTYCEFLKCFIENQNKLKTTKQHFNLDKYGEFYTSCTPDIKATSLSVPYNKDYTIPQFIWDKFDMENNNVFVNLFVFANHAFVDGFHISKLISEFNKVQESFK